jgi:hypothetical protein
VLDLVAGSAREVTCRDALPLLAGCYLGEGLRRALGLGWRGTLRDPDHARVEGSAGSWRPILLVAERLAHGHALGLEQALERARPRSDHPPTVIAARPPCPWDPAPWPAPSRLPAYARALRRSVIGVWCKKTSGLELDGSVKSLAAIDAWLELVAPASSPPEPASARRVIVLAGAYLGETLREATGGRWLAADDTRLSPDSYVLDLGPGEVARPIEHAFARVTRGGLSFGEYAARWIERVR